MTKKRDPHSGLHSEQGGLPGEHPGRAKNPLVKVEDLAFLEFEKPDLDRAERFAEDFGFAISLRTPEEIHLRGTDAGSPALVIRRANRSRFVGPAFRAADAQDVRRLAEATGRSVTSLPETIGGITVDLADPSGTPVRVVADTRPLPSLPGQEPLTLNFGHDVPRTNATQRPPRQPARVQRLGHVVMQSNRYLETLNWYLEHLGLIVSDFMYYPGQRERGPVMSFIRCDRGTTPSDHHTLALSLGAGNHYLHSAYQIADLDSLAAGGEHLLDRGWKRSWGIGRHIQGSQIFDYWRDPDGFMVEHFTDGDMFDSTVEPGWAQFSVATLGQWGPRPTRDFLGTGSAREALSELRDVITALRGDNEFDLGRLRGLMKGATS